MIDDMECMAVHTSDHEPFRCGCAYSKVAFYRYKDSGFVVAE